MSSPLQQLAQSVGLLAGYHATDGRWIEPSDVDLLATLQAYGLDIERAEDAGALSEELARHRAGEIIAPVAVAWDGRLPSIPTLAVGSATQLRLESGAVWDRETDLALADGHVVLRRVLPFGRHELAVHTERGDEHRCVIFSAPSVTWRPQAGAERRWGIFAPTYALRRRDAPSAVGDLADLEAAFDWLHRRGGDVVVTLPMLATFLDEPAEISPYAPVSRRFWNELFADVRAPAERAGLDLGSVQGGLVDYRSAWAPRRAALQQLADRLSEDVEVRHWVAQNPLVEMYARFRAAGHRHGRNWRDWPSRLPADLDAADVRRHVTAQWLMDRQLARLQRKVSSRGQLLALDLPLGSHPDGFDVWQDPELFVGGVSAGAPPDSFFTLGQDWGFPPIHPERSRRQGHAFLQDCIRHHVRHAGLLRIDHILGLLRLFWVRQSAGPAGGVYVSYPLEELLAVIALESSRVGAVVVGENLGTVPPEVTEAMVAHGVLGCAVSQFDMGDVRRDSDAIPTPPAASVATLNTHDTATFAGFWSGEDSADRADLGLLNEDELLKEQAARAELREILGERLGLDAGSDPPDSVEAAAALLAVASNSDAAMVVINVEDGWAEPAPQNVPGTVSERPNWKRRVAVPIEEWSEHPGLQRLVDAVARARPGWDRPAADTPGEAIGLAPEG